MLPLKLLKSSFKSSILDSNIPTSPNHILCILASDPANRGYGSEQDWGYSSVQNSNKLYGLQLHTSYPSTIGCKYMAFKFSGTKALISRTRTSEHSCKKKLSAFNISKGLQSTVTVANYELIHSECERLVLNQIMYIVSISWSFIHVDHHMWICFESTQNETQTSRSARPRSKMASKRGTMKQNETNYGHIPIRYVLKTSIF